MLRNVLGAYLNTISEREFDLPFLTLLPAMGFYDVHYTHGQGEFGKDVIAKKADDAGPIQHSFQLKAGDIDQASWRNSIMQQMLESLLVGLSHPNFDHSLPHQTVLVTTGRLTSNAALGLQDLNKAIEAKYQKRPIGVWDREHLIECLKTHGLESVHYATASGFVDYGQFYVLYGRVLQGDFSERDIEKHSRRWLDKSLADSQRLLGSAIEAEILASRLRRQGFLYEAVHAYLTVLRAVLYSLYAATVPDQVKQSLQIYEQVMTKLLLACRTYVSEVQVQWTAAEKDLVRLVSGPPPMMEYLVHAARVLEIAGCLYFLEPDSSEKHAVASFIADLIQHEPGCAHTPSDRYSVSLVFPILALAHDGQASAARDLLRRAVVWLCDRYEEGDGIAPLEADPFGEITSLFGYRYEFAPPARIGGSFAASVICDLAAFLGDPELYSDVVNDVKASNIFPQYWQVPNSDGLFQIQASDVISYPNIEYEDKIGEFRAYEYAEHIRHEPQAFRIAELVDPLGLMGVMLLLRDRYFPTLWLSLTAKPGDGLPMASAIG